MQASKNAIQLIAEECERNVELGIVRGEDDLEVRERERLRGGIFENQEGIIELDEFVLESVGVQEEAQHEEGNAREK